MNNEKESALNTMEQEINELKNQFDPIAVCVQFQSFYLRFILRKLVMGTKYQFKHEEKQNSKFINSKNQERANNCKPFVMKKIKYSKFSFV